MHRFRQALVAALFACVAAACSSPTGGSTQASGAGMAGSAGTAPPTTTTGSVTPSVSAPGPSPTAARRSAPPPAAPVVHGKDITTANTGYLAWRGADGRRCTDADLKVYATKVSASQLGNATCVWLKQGLTVDKAVTITAARIDRPVRSDGPKLTINWSVIDGHGDGTMSVGGRNVDVYRSQIVNASDGVRLEAMSLVEDYIRVVTTSPEDHNDAVQAYLASAGGSILRCNIDGRPVGGSVAGNAAIFIADNSRGTLEIRDNYLAGGGYALRLHESMTYRVTGNIMADYAFGPVSTTNAVQGAFVEWSNNRTKAGAAVNR